VAELAQLRDEAVAAAQAAGDLSALDAVRVKYLGKKGLLTLKLRDLGSLPADERPAAGKEINLTKQALTEIIDERRKLLDGERLSYRTLDVEQIGSVYETMMGFRLETATGDDLQAAVWPCLHGADPRRGLRRVLRADRARNASGRIRGSKRRSHREPDRERRDERRVFHLRHRAPLRQADRVPKASSYNRALQRR